MSKWIVFYKMYMLMLEYTISKKMMSQDNK